MSKIFTSIRVSKLNQTTQDKIIRLQRGSGTGYFFPTYNVSGEFISNQSNSLRTKVLIWLLISIIWTAYLFYLAFDYAWSLWNLAILSFISIIVLSFLIKSFIKFYQVLNSNLRPSISITPKYFIKIMSRSIKYTEIQNIKGIIKTESISTSGRIDQVEVAFLFDGEKDENATIPTQKAKAFFEDFDIWQQNALANKVDRQKYEIFSLSSSQDDIPQNELIRNLAKVTLFVSVSLLLSFGLTGSAYFLNGYIADTKIWSNAIKENSANSFRTYLKEMPVGRYRYEAENKIAEKYDKVINLFSEKATKKVNQASIQAVIQLLKTVKVPQTHQVPIYFERINKIPNNLSDQMKNKYNVKDLFPVGDSFSDEKMLKREASILTAINLAFQNKISKDLLEFYVSDEKNKVPSLNISYEIEPSDGVFYTSEQTGTSYCGIQFNWSCQLKNVESANSFSFSLNSKPSGVITNKYYAGEPSQFKSAYDLQADSAFVNFSSNLKTELSLD